MDRMQNQRQREALLLSLIAVFALAFAGMFTLEIWGVHPWRGPVDYSRFGNWSDAISGIGTTAAVVVALAAISKDRTTRRMAEAARLVNEETAVFQWVTSKEVRDEIDRLVGRVWDLRIQNSTIAPIYQWSVLFESNDHVCNYQKRPLLPGENIFNAPFLDDLDPSASPEPLLVFEAR